MLDAPPRSLNAEPRTWLPMANAAPSPTSRPKPPRTWQAKFGDALRGLKFGIRGHSSFFVHFFCAAWVVAAALVFQCTLLEWAALLGCIGLVLTAELFNSALETLFRGLEPRVKDRTFRALDIAAGAVLLASLTAASVGFLILGPKLLKFLGWA